MKQRKRTSIPPGWLALVALAVAMATFGGATPSAAAVVNADIVAIDQVLWYNRLGAVNPVGMIYALKRDVVPLTPGTTPGPGNAMLREDKRPRPIVLRVNEGDTLHITFTNWLNPQALVAPAPGSANPIEVEQPATRKAGVTVLGMQLVGSIASDGSNVGKNASSLAAPGETREYTVYAEKEGAYLLNSTAANTGGEGQMGTLALGLFGAVNVEPAGSTWYRSQLTRQEMDWATTGQTPAGQPLVDYEAVYPAGHPFAGIPILRMLDAGGNLVHSDIHAIITGFAPNHYPPNPAYPDRNEPFREFTVVFHDEIKAIQAFPAIYNDPAFNFALGSVKDGFAINYATGGIATEILSNRLGVGPMFDCVDCKAEEFFLTSWAVGDPGMVVDVPANAGLETLAPGQVPDPADVGRKATVAFYPDDPSNVNHSYMNDHVKIRNVHAGREHHIFHLHTHQWLFTPDDDNSNYIDFQGIGPGSSYSYEIAYEGSGNRNKTPGDAIYHCHFYPHFAQGMWAHWRVHDVFENGTVIDPATGKPVPGARALPDAEILAGTPIPALVPIPGLPMAPMPGGLHIDNATGQIVFDEPGVNPGFPFFIAGKAGHRPPTPPLDIAEDSNGGLLDGGIGRHIITGGTALSEVTPLSLNKILETVAVELVPEAGTVVEQTAMAYHAQQWHPTYDTNGNQASFELNGLPPQPGAPYADPCRADDGSPTGNFRTYRPVVIELDTVFNKAGWHFGQQRIEVLEQDVAATLAKTRPPEPLVMRANTGDCMEVYHTNLVPGVYQQDAFQVKTPTDVIGQHIHLVKFDVTSSDGAANGWNYEDGTFSPDEVKERIHAIRAQNGCDVPNADLTGVFCPEPKAGFNGVLGARTTIQRVYVDPLLNNQGVDRGLGNVFSHDHYGPSTHQQAGLYATLLVEPQGSTWRDSQTGAALGTRSTTPGGDGGPTSWRADILNGQDSYREAYFEFADFQLAYDAAGNPVNPPDRLEPGLPFLVEPNPLLRPEVISSKDVGTFVVNYRNEPLALRVRNPATNAQAAGNAGDLSFAFSSLVTRADPKMNVQPAVYPPLTADVAGTDPFTPLLRAYNGDKFNLRLQVGATEETHNATVHGVKWLQEYASPSSGYRNTQAMGISEQFQFRTPMNLSATSLGSRADHLYKVNSSTDGAWNGSWGLLRTYNALRSDLQPLPNNPITASGKTIKNRTQFREFCPTTAPVRTYDVSAVLAKNVLPGGTLTYNYRTSDPLGVGPLNDPTGILFVETKDLDAAGKLKADAPIEPLVLRAAAGECVEVTLRNKLPATMPDLAGFNTLPLLVNHFNNNQLKPSSSVGLHAQLVAYDVTRGDGSNVGRNAGTQTAGPGATRLYRWYAGDISTTTNADGSLNLVAKPAEWGGVNLSSSDPIKHAGKGALGALVIEPPGTSWVEDMVDHDRDPATPNRRSRTSVTVYKDGAFQFRDFALISQTDVNLRDKNGAELLSALSEQEPEDSGHKAYNYGTEPMWFRMGYAPSLTGEATDALDFSNVLSNSQVGGADPATPVFKARAGEAVRFRILEPAGHARNGVFALHGHVWEREPHTADSLAIGHNPKSFWRGSQEGVGASSHYEVVPANGAGGKFGVTGDYLFRDWNPVKFDNGQWGIFRVE